MVSFFYLKDKIHTSYPEIVKEIQDKKVISPELEEKMKKAYESFSNDYVQSIDA